MSRHAMSTTFSARPTRAFEVCRNDSNSRNAVADPDTTSMIHRASNRNRRDRIDPTKPHWVPRCKLPLRTQEEPVMDHQAMKQRRLSDRAAKYLCHQPK